MNHFISNKKTYTWFIKTFIDSISICWSICRIAGDRSWLSQMEPNMENSVHEVRTQMSPWVKVEGAESNTKCPLLNDFLYSWQEPHSSSSKETAAEEDEVMILSSSKLSFSSSSSSIVGMRWLEQDKESSSCDQTQHYSNSQPLLNLDLKIWSINSIHSSPENLTARGDEHISFLY